VASFFYAYLLGSSIGQGTITRLPQLAQLASNIYQDISYSSKVARIENTLEPQGQACSGPRDLRSVPNLGGRVSGSFCLFLRRVGRRNIQTEQSQRTKRCPCSNSPSAHIVHILCLVKDVIHFRGVSHLHPDTCQWLVLLFT